MGALREALMLAPEPQAHILKELQRYPAVLLTNVATLLNATEMSVRRDIETLINFDSAKRLHGGATKLARFIVLELGFVQTISAGWVNCQPALRSPTTDVSFGSSNAYHCGQIRAAS